MKRFVKRWTLRIAVGACVLASANAQLSSASAPAATPVMGGFVPDPAACHSEPRSIENVTALFVDAASPAEYTPPTSVTVPLGMPADPAVSNAVTAVIHEAFACLNAGDYGRFLAHLTDKALIVEFPWVGEALANDDFLAEFASPKPLPAELRQTILAVGNIIRLEDGRSAAVVSYIDPASDVPGTEVLFLIFTLQDDHWLIDEAIDFSVS